MASFSDIRDMETKVNNREAVSARGQNFGETGGLGKSQSLIDLLRFFATLLIICSSQESDFSLPPQLTSRIAGPARIRAALTSVLSAGRAPMCATIRESSIIGNYAGSRSLERIDRRLLVARPHLYF